jgi:hypothetical protein
MKLQSVYEVSEDYKHMAKVGRAMMDMSEYANCKGMKEADFKLLNDMSHVGNMMTKVGNAFGPTMKSFTTEDLDLIKRFEQKEIDIPQM